MQKFLESKNLLINKFNIYSIIAVCRIVNFKIIDENPNF